MSVSGYNVSVVHLVVGLTYTFFNQLVVQLHTCTRVLEYHRNCTQVPAVDLLEVQNGPLFVYLLAFIPQIVHQGC
jgi:hypothetical protein